MIDRNRIRVADEQQSETGAALAIEYFADVKKVVAKICPDEATEVSIESSAGATALNLVIGLLFGKYGPETTGFIVGQAIGQSVSFMGPPRAQTFLRGIEDGVGVGQTVADLSKGPKP